MLLSGKFSSRKRVIASSDIFTVDQFVTVTSYRSINIAKPRRLISEQSE